MRKRHGPRPAPAPATVLWAYPVDLVLCGLCFTARMALEATYGVTPYSEPYTGHERPCDGCGTAVEGNLA